MDQAISLLGQAGTALKIDFFPLRVEVVPFPHEYAVVVSNSMVRATKSGGARAQYNRRVVECRLAAALGAHAASKRLGRTIHSSLLSDLAPERIGLKAAEIDSLVRAAAGESPLSMQEVAVRLGMQVAELKEAYCRLRSGAPFDEPADGLKLWKRYRHVVTEARRVGLAQEAFRQGNIGGVGQLMYQSHESCRDDYEVSCQELETLVSLARIHKATGSRLTGAGFGGCTVSLVPKAEAAEFAQRLWQEYCTQRPEIAQVRAADAVFVTSPADGAGELVCAF
jgi:N-acetylgalactosamine kinase